MKLLGKLNLEKCVTHDYVDNEITLNHATGCYENSTTEAGGIYENHQKEILCR